MRATTNQFFDESGEPIGCVEAHPDQIENFPFLASGSANDAERVLIYPGREVDEFVKNGLQTDKGTSSFLHRALDITVSVALLVLLLPVMLLVVTAIKMSGSGPAIFIHRRIGKGGDAFGCLKFRTMRCGAEAGLPAILAADPELEREWAQNQKLLEDPRVTLIGQFLRNTSLDELPQLLNVLRGDMALVGPRPIVAEELERYGRHASSYMSVKPGLTGLWQVTRDASTSYRRRIAADVMYVRNRSLTLDLKIVLATVPAVLIGGGAC